MSRHRVSRVNNVITRYTVSQFLYSNFLACVLLSIDLDEDALRLELLPVTFTNWIEQGLTSHHTHYRSYWGRGFTGQMT